MAKAVRSIEINAPQEKIWEYIVAPANLLEIWPSMVEAKDIQPLSNGGNFFRWTYKMAGMRFEGTSEDTLFEPPHKVVSANKGGIDGIITWTLESVPSGIKVTFEADYTIPIPLLGKLAESFIVRQNEQEGETILANLKSRMEV